jgi:hypothetical protein
MSRVPMPDALDQVTAADARSAANPAGTTTATSRSAGRTIPRSPLWVSHPQVRLY